MDSKLTLSFNKDIIEEAKIFAENNGISLSRLVEHLLRKSTSSTYRSIEDFPISDWVMELMEGPVTYNDKPLSNKQIRAKAYEYKFAKKKKAAK